MSNPTNPPNPADAAVQAAGRQPGGAARVPDPDSPTSADVVAEMLALGAELRAGQAAILAELAAVKHRLAALADIAWRSRF